MNSVAIIVAVVVVISVILMWRKSRSEGYATMDTGAGPMVPTWVKSNAYSGHTIYVRSHYPISIDIVMKAPNGPVWMSNTGYPASSPMAGGLNMNIANVDLELFYVLPNVYCSGRGFTRLQTQNFLEVPYNSAESSYRYPGLETASTESWLPRLSTTNKPYFRYPSGTVLASPFGPYYIVIANHEYNGIPMGMSIYRITDGQYQMLRGASPVFHSVPVSSANFNALLNYARSLGYDATTTFWAPYPAFVETGYTITKPGLNLTNAGVLYGSTIRDSEDHCAALSHTMLYSYNPSTRECIERVGLHTPGISMGIRGPDGAWKVYLDSNLPGYDIASVAATSHEQCQSLVATNNGDWYSFNGSNCWIKRAPKNSALRGAFNTQLRRYRTNMSTPVSKVANGCWKGPTAAIYRVNGPNDICHVRDSANYRKHCGPLWSSHQLGATTDIIGNNLPAAIPKCPV